MFSFSLKQINKQQQQQNPTKTKGKQTKQVIKKIQAKIPLLLEIAIIKANWVTVVYREMKPIFPSLERD